MFFDSFFKWDIFVRKNVFSLPRIIISEFFYEKYFWWCTMARPRAICCFGKKITHEMPQNLFSLKECNYEIDIGLSDLCLRRALADLQARNSKATNSQDQYQLSRASLDSFGPFRGRWKNLIRFERAAIYIRLAGVFLIFSSGHENEIYCHIFAAIFTMRKSIYHTANATFREDLFASLHRLFMPRFHSRVGLNAL